MSRFAHLSRFSNQLRDDFPQASPVSGQQGAALHLAVCGVEEPGENQGTLPYEVREDLRGRAVGKSLVSEPERGGRQVAFIGCGKYAFSNIASYLRKRRSRFLRLTFDKHPSRAMSLCRAYCGAAAVADWREILEDPRVRTVFIASNYASHAEYALACVEAGKQSILRSRT